MHAEKAHHKPPRINTCKPALRRTCKPAPRLHTMLQPCMQRKPKRPMMRMVHAASAGCCNGPGACPTCTKLQLPLQAASRWSSCCCCTVQLLLCPGSAAANAAKGVSPTHPSPPTIPTPQPQNTHTYNNQHKNTKLQVSAHSSPIKCSNLRPLLAKHGQRWHQSLAQNGFE